MSARSPFDNLTGVSFGAYRCVELLERSDLGPLYLARGDSADAVYWLRVLPVQVPASPREQSAYYDRFLRQAEHVATLQHPHILPLLDYGYEGGLPYLVYPAVAPRTLSSQLAERGPLDLSAAARYLDQIAAALAYAHERATLHRHLSTDTLVLQREGQIAVAAFGVRRMIELSEPGGEANPLRFSVETAAPEQLTARPVERAADIYALGAVLYRMLAGTPVFVGRTREEIARQHVYTPVPALSQARPGLPPQLDDILATAMAKQPERRFPRPEALVAAFLQATTPQRPSRVLPPVVPAELTIAAGRRASGPSLRALPAGAVESGRLRSSDAPGGTAGPPDGSLTSVQRAWEDSFLRTRQAKRPRNWLLVLTAATLIAAVVGTLYVLRGGTPAAGPASARVLFADSSPGRGTTDALQVTATNLADPPTGSRYVAWLINSQTELVVPLGTLVRQGSTSSTYSVAFASRPGAPLPNANLLDVGDTFEITLERSSASVPTGTPVLRGHFPAISFVHIQHILVSFPTTPGKIGLLVGMLKQTALLVAHSDALQAAAQARDQSRELCQAHLLVNILEGTQGQHYAPVSPACAGTDPAQDGDGFGLLSGQSAGSAGAGSGQSSGYIAEAAEHASLAATQPDATADMHAHLSLLIACVNNVRAWETQLDADAQALLANPGDTARVQEIVTLAHHAYNGYDANHDGTVAPATGEGGAIIAYQQGQQMATLVLTPGS